MAVTKEQLQERMEYARQQRMKKKQEREEALGKALDRIAELEELLAKKSNPQEVSEIKSELKDLKGEINTQKPQTQPWKPAKRLEIPDSWKDPRFTYRWVDKKKVGNLEKKLLDGWEIDKHLSKRFSDLQGIPSDFRDGVALDGTTQRAELIVMRMPKEIAESRNKFYTDRANRAFKEQKKRFSQESIEATGDSRTSVYGEIKESEREFIRRE